MHTLEKLQKIIHWFKDTYGGEVSNLVPRCQIEKIGDIECILGEEFPPNLLAIHKMHDGDDQTGAGSFLGHYLMSLGDIFHQLQYSQSMMKPKKPVIDDPLVSGDIVQKIVRICKRAIPIRFRTSGSGVRWHKLAITGSQYGIAKPLVFFTRGNGDEERYFIELSDAQFQKLRALVAELHKLEEASFNWDTLEVSVTRNGDQLVQRQFHDISNTISGRKYPEGTIKKVYSNVKWLPLLNDGSGNFIGVDLDPGPSGISGQVINFGADQFEISVLANSWDEFLDELIVMIERGGEEFMNLASLDDVFRTR